MGGSSRNPCDWLRLFGDPPCGEALERWTRSVTPAASRPQSAVALVLTIHLPAIVLMCPPGGLQAISNSERGCDMRALAGLKTSQLNRSDGVLAPYRTRERTCSRVRLGHVIRYIG